MLFTYNGETQDITQMPAGNGKPIIYQRNRFNSCALSTRSEDYPRGLNNELTSRDCYYMRRHEIRQLRKHSPSHMDVAWYMYGLGLDPYTTDVCVRTNEFSSYWSAITGPVGKLPA